MMDATSRTNLPKRATPLPLDQLPQVSSIAQRYDEQLRREQGRRLGTPDAYDAATEHVYSVVKAAQLMRERMGEEWTAESFSRLSSAYPNGVPEAKFEDAFASIKRAGMFRVVNGGAE